MNINWIILLKAVGLVSVGVLIISLVMYVSYLFIVAFSPFGELLLFSVLGSIGAFCMLVGMVYKELDR